MTQKFSRRKVLEVFTDRFVEQILQKFPKHDIIYANETRFSVLARVVARKVSKDVKVSTFYPPAVKSSLVKQRQKILNDIIKISFFSKLSN